MESLNLTAAPHWIAPTPSRGEALSESDQIGGETLWFFPVKGMTGILVYRKPRCWDRREQRVLIAAAAEKIVRAPKN